MNTKFFLYSRTLQGLIVAAIASVYLVMTGAEAGEEVTSSITQVVAQVLEWIGILVAFYGRWSANQPLSTTKSLTDVQ